MVILKWYAGGILQVENLISLHLSIFNRKIVLRSH